MHGVDTRVVKLVTTNSDTHAMEFIFVWTEVDNEAAVGDFAAPWNL